MAVVKEFILEDYILFIGMLVISLSIGLYYALFKKQKTTQEFLVAKRSMTVLPISFSLVVSYMSAILIIGVPSEIYFHGVLFWEGLVGMLLAIPIAGFIFIPVFYNLKMISVYEYLELRFESRIVRCMASLTFIIQIILYMGVVLYAPAIALSSVVNFPSWASLVCVGTIGTIYTALGGLRAVVFTDLFQAFIMFAGLLAIIIQGSINIGSFTEVFRIGSKYGRLDLWEWSLDPFMRHTTLIVFFGQAFFWASIYGCHQSQVQRYSSMKSLSGAIRALLINDFLLLIIISLANIAGLTIFANYVDCDPLKLGLISKKDQILPFFVMDKLSSLTGLPGLFVACLFSGALSTISTGLNSLAAVTWDDFLKDCSCFKDMKEKKKMFVTKIIAFSYGVIALGFAFIAGQMGGVVQTAITVNGAVCGPLLGIFTLGVLFPCTNKKGAIIGMLVGHAITLWISIGGMLLKDPPTILPTSTEQCDVYNNITTETDSSLVLMNNITANDYLDDALITDFPLHTENVTSFNHSITLVNETKEWPDKIYTLSYQLYPVLGSIVTVVVGLVISFITGRSTLQDIDPGLISPLAVKLYRCTTKEREDGFHITAAGHKEEGKSSGKEVNSLHEIGLDNIGYNS